MMSRQTHSTRTEAMDPISDSARKPRVLIVVPCYNEANRLQVGAFRDFADGRNDVRFLFVNDGSTDGTERLLQELADADPSRFALLSLPGNSGKAEAVRRGLLAALATDAEYVGYWDADLATPLDAIPDFLAAFHERPAVEMVFGSRVRLLGRDIERSLLRHYLGRAFATAASLVLGIAVYDTQCGAKLFRATAQVRGLFQEPFASRWVFDVEIIARAVGAHARGEGPALGTLAYELPLKQWRDVRGSKLRAWHFAGAAADLLRIYWRYMRRLRNVETAP